jgi:O-antigen ligase
VELSRRIAPWAEAGPLVVGPTLAAVGAGLVLAVLGPVSLLPLLVLAATTLLGFAALVRYDLPFTFVPFYLLFETVVGDWLPTPLDLVSKDLVYLLAVALGLLHLAARPQPARARPPAGATAAVLAYFLLHVLLTLRGPTLLLGALSFRGTVFLAWIAVLMPVAYADAAARRRGLGTLIVGLCAVAVVGLWETAAWEQVREVLDLEVQRWTMGTLKAGSTVGSAGALGAVMAVGLIFLSARLLEGRLGRGTVMVGTVLAGLWGAGLVVSFSRISQIAFVAVLLVLFLRRPRILVPGLLLLVLAGAVADWATGGFFLGNLAATVGRGEHLDAIQSTADRLEIIRQTLHEYWPRHPWLGWGLGSAGAHTLTHLEDAPLGFLFLDNMYLKALVEGGLVGLGSYLAFLAATLLGAWRLDRNLAGRDGVDPWRRALVRGAGGVGLFYAVVGVASTVPEMPVVNASWWWAVGWLFVEAARQRAEEIGP